MPLILLIAINLLVILELVVNFLSLLLTKPFDSICGHVKSIILNCCKSATILFFFQIGLLLFSFVSYTFFYSMMFREIENGELPNPPQVIVHLCSLFFLFKYPQERVRERHMLIRSLFISSIYSFFFRGGSPQLLFVFSLCYVLLIYLLGSSDLTLFIIFLLSLLSEDKGWITRREDFLGQISLST